MKLLPIVSKFEKMIKAQSGVLYVTGKPGIGKSAIFKSLAEKNGWDFIDIRLSQMDETDIIGIPYQKDMKTEEGTIKVLAFAPPEWLVRAMQKPTLVMFDEINRASIGVRNASLQLLNERQCGSLKLNKNVYMVAVGNLGDKGGSDNQGDGCEVESFDPALNNRLIHYVFDMKFPEWCEGYANEHVNSVIVSFIKAHPEFYYRMPPVDSYECAYPTFRSWTFMSDFIGKESGVDDFLADIEEVGHSYIGAAVTKFIRYCKDMQAFNINDILKDYDKIEDRLKALNRDMKSELLASLRKVDLVNLLNNKKTAYQVENAGKFLNLIDEDERVAFLNNFIEAIDIEVVKANPDFKKFLKQFANIFDKITALIGDDKSDKK